MNVSTEPSTVNGRERASERTEAGADLSPLREQIDRLEREVRRLREAVQDPDAPELVDVSTAAERLSISERSLRSFVSDGTIRSVKVGRRRLIPVEALNSFVEDRLDGGTV